MKEAKSFLCFWFSCVVFLSSAWKNVGMPVTCNRYTTTRDPSEIHQIFICQMLLEETLTSDMTAEITQHSFFYQASVIKNQLPPVSIIFFLSKSSFENHSLLKTFLQSHCPYIYSCVCECVCVHVVCINFKNMCT